MKKLFFLLAVFCTIQAYSQPYSITFAGTGLSTVKVQNLTSGVVVDVPAGDVLFLSNTVGIPEVNIKSSRIKIYPNPMTDKSTLEFLPPLAGDAIISVCDMTGKVLTQFNGYVDNYTQEFSLSGIKNGLHVINVQGNGYQFSEKLLSGGKSKGTASIEKISNNIQPVVEKKSIKDSKGVQGNVNMAYNSGERLIYTAVSGNNKTVITDIPAVNKTVTFTFTECKDGDNINYPVVEIGTQTWMAENIKTTKYRDGVSIGTTNPYNKDISGESAPAYQWAFAGNESNVAVYGRLYTWYAVTDSRNVCPTGWHMPTDAEWTTLENYLIANGYNFDGTTTFNYIAKALASTSLWTSDASTGAIGNTGYPAKRNATGFTALPGGFRNVIGTFTSVGTYATWWSATERDATDAWGYYLGYLAYNLAYNHLSKKIGDSVRCLRD